jgi:PPOX class probable F420-dependent enzyme
MAKQRDAIRMTPAEIATLYDQCKSLQVATLDKDGAPHLTTVWYLVDGDGNFLFETYGKSQKVVNMRRDPRVALLLEAGTEYAELRGLSVQGRAEIVDGGDRLMVLMGDLVRHHNPELTAQQAAAVTAQMAAKRVVVIVRADKLISWDHRKLVSKVSPVEVPG